MIIIFKSRAAADVIMLGEVAQRMFEVIGKPFEPQGVITVEELPEAIARLKQAMADDKAARAQPRPAEEERDETRPPAISLTQRIVPLLELFEAALKADKAVTWGN